MSLHQVDKMRTGTWMKIVGISDDDIHTLRVCVLLYFYFMSLFSWAGAIVHGD